MFDRNLSPGPTVDGAVPWSALDPSSASRRVGFLTLNGAIMPHNNFKRGLDIRSAPEFKCTHIVQSPTRPTGLSILAAARPFWLLLGS